MSTERAEHGIATEHPADAVRVVVEEAEQAGFVGVLFLTLEDEHDLVECTLFPEVFRRYAAEARGAGPFVVEGTIEDSG